MRDYMGESIQKKAKTVMRYEELTDYYNDLLRLATSKCSDIHDAEDLTSETLLAAYAYMKHGGEIAYPRTWLANTLMHKYNDMMRKRYRMPCVVNLDFCEELADGEDGCDEESEEYAKLRSEVNILAGATREIIIRYYFGKSSVGEIAKALSLTEGTVKRRLFSGREQIRKGFEMKENETNALPGRLYMGFGGEDGKNGEPVSLVECDLIAQNLLMLAYEKPLKMSELSRSIGIPSAYIEPIVARLVDGELMKKTGDEKYFSDFLIMKPNDMLSRFSAQLDFAKSHFEKSWQIVGEMLTQIDELGVCDALGERQRVKLERYAVLKALQDFQHEGTGAMSKLSFPNRRDGGRWYAQAVAMPAGYDGRELRSKNEYTIVAGHRTSIKDSDKGGGARLGLYEFDTTLWDSTARFSTCGYACYFKHIHTLLWCIYRGVPLDESDVPNSMIECLPALENVGLLSYDNDDWRVDIPVLTRETYDKLLNLIGNATNILKSELGNDYAKLLKENIIDVPPHLKSVPDLYRYIPATNYIVMAIVREAYERGLHLSGVDYCCPPAVLVYQLT